MRSVNGVFFIVLDVGRNGLVPELCEMSRQYYSMYTVATSREGTLNHFGQIVVIR